MQLPFKTLKKDDIQSRVSCFVYGFPGAGKTWLAGTLLDHEALWPALVCVCDSGELTIKDKLDPERFHIKRCGLKDLSDVANFLVSKQNPFKSVFIDNLTELHRSALLERARISSAGKDRTEYEFTQADYGIARNQMLAVISAFALQMPKMSVFVTALAYNVQNELTGTMTIEPGLSGKLAGEVPGYFDVVGYLKAETPSAAQIRKAEAEGKAPPETRRVLVVEQTSQIPFARNRGGLLGREVISPTLPALYERLHGK